MKKIHITLVGGQPAPIYNAIASINPDKVIYICSNSENSIKVLKSLKQEINIESQTINLDTTSPIKIEKCAQTLAQTYKDDEVTINISSGLKSWAYWFSVVFHPYTNASVVYIDQNNLLWNYRTMQSSNDLNFDMHILFRLYGNSIENNYVPFDHYTPEDFLAIKKIEEMRRFNFQVFNKLTTLLSKEQSHQINNNKVGEFTLDKSSVSWDKTTSTIKISLWKHDRNERCSITSPHATQLLFNTNWFEIKVAQILSQWDKAKEICVNCKFPFNKNLDKNEVDIIVNTGTKLLFVECKTQIASTTDIDKFRSVIKNYGGMGSKGLFITDAPMKDMAKAKCDEHNIISLSLKDDHSLLGANKALYLLLNNEIDNLNTK